ncbi:Ff.00g073930.m01.CDS01 [Fusarium sp. VM40]|nr:Ff.00g073930.m01.CDS01 [Fusarium sp. VM40]
MEAPSVPDRRYSLFDEINNIESTDDNEIFRLVTNLDEHVANSEGFRWHAVSTQKAQDRVRSNYRHFLRAIKVINDSMSGEEVDREMFLVNQREVTKRLKLFIMFIAKFGRGRAQGVKISYRGLVVYRNCLMFWVDRMATIYSTTPLPRRVLFITITEAMRYATQSFGLNTTGNMEMSKIGLAELRQLIDIDMITTPEISVAELHHLAWCIGRVCAVRPGSLARSDHRPVDAPEKPFLTWGDIELSRGSEDGKFTAKITIRNLKTNYKDPEKARNKGSAPSELKCIIKSPQVVSNLIFSIPHRLLVIAIRRGILAGIQTLDQLLSSELQYITIRQEFLDKPVFLAAGPRGLTLTEKSMRATALTTYISLRGKKIGYAQDLTFYSLRRRAATDLSRKIGKDAARSLMNHDPNSRILEKYYLSLEDTLDVSGLALDELDGRENNDGHTEDLLKAGNDLAIHVLSNERARRVHGPALNALMNQMMAGDENYPALASAETLRYYKRRVRRAAFKTLLAKEVQDQRLKMSQTDYNERLERLGRSRLIQFVLSQARQNLEAPEPSEDEITGDEPDSAVDENTGLFVHDVEELHEEDLDEQVEEAGDAPVHRDLDEEQLDFAEHANDFDDDISYFEAAKAFMQLILDNPMSEYQNLRSEGVHCSRCQEDETISQELKNKKYFDATHLHDHEQSKLHLPKQKWKRQITRAFEASGETRIACPYCKQLGKDSSFFHIKALVKHIEYGNFGDGHDRLKRADGWYDDGWDKNPKAKLKTFLKNSERQRQVKLASLNIRYSQYEPAAGPVPHPTIPGVLLGPGSRTITRPGVKFVSTDELSKPSPVPEHQKPLIKSGDPFEPFEVPKHYEDFVKITRMRVANVEAGQPADSAGDGAGSDAGDDAGNEN